MSNIFVQDSGFTFFIPSTDKLMQMVDVFEIYRVDNRSEGLVDDPDTMDEFIDKGITMGVEIGNLMDIDEETLENVLYAKKKGKTTEYINQIFNEELNVNCPEIDEINGYTYSHNFNLWFLKNTDDEIYNRIITLNSSY